MHTARALIVLAALLVLLGSSADAATTPPSASTDVLLERFEALERRFEELAAENRALREQLTVALERRSSPEQSPTTAPASTPARTPPVHVTAAGKQEKFALGGFMHINGEVDGSPGARWNGIRDRVFIRRARLAVAGTFSDRRRYVSLPW